MTQLAHRAWLHTHASRCRCCRRACSRLSLPLSPLSLLPLPLLPLPLSPLPLPPLPLLQHLQLLRAKIETLSVSAKGARVLAWAQLPESGGGNFMSPTLITGVPLPFTVAAIIAVPADRHCRRLAGVPNEVAAREELFGPVATVHTFAEEEEAVMLANASPGILQAYVFAGDEPRAMALGRRIRAGLVRALRMLFDPAAVA